jgi:predicted dehydrogenase/type 1 glutamine amidotransferase
MQKILFLIGGRYHDFQACGAILKAALEGTGQFTVEMTEDSARLAQAGDFHAVLLFTSFGHLTDSQEKSFLNTVRSGCGVVGIHCANYSFQESPGYVEMIGSRFERLGTVAPFSVELAEGAESITPRIAPNFTVTDEYYVLKKTTEAALQPVLNGWWQFEKTMVAYARDYGQGRVFYTSLGHDERTFRHPEFQNLIVKALKYVTRQAEKTIRIGLLGYGPAYRMGQHHAGQIAATRGLTLTAVCDRDPARLQAAKEEQGQGIATFTDARDMARSGAIDLGVVILPHAYHYDGIQTLLDAGIHVITEKPFAVTVRECDDLIRLASAQNRMLSVYHNRHWDPDVMTIASVLQAGTIGAVFSLECNMCHFGRPGQAWRSHKAISGGAAYDMGAHQFEKVFQLVPRTNAKGEPINRKATLFGNFLKRKWYDTTNEDFVRAYVRFDSGLEAQLMVSDLCAAPKPLWTVLGTAGSIVMSNWQTPVTVYTVADDGRTLTTEVPHVKAPHLPYYRNIADHLLCGLPLIITAQVGKRPIQCIEGCEQAAREGRVVDVTFD